MHRNRQKARCLKDLSLICSGHDCHAQALQGMQEHVVQHPCAVARCCTAKASAWRVAHWAPRLGRRRPGLSGHKSRENANLERPELSGCDVTW